MDAAAAVEPLNINDWEQAASTALKLSLDRVSAFLNTR